MDKEILFLNKSDQKSSNLNPSDWTKKQYTSVNSSNDFEIGLPAPCPAAVSRRINKGVLGNLEPSTCCNWATYFKECSGTTRLSWSAFDSNEQTLKLETLNVINNYRFFSKPFTGKQQSCRKFFNVFGHIVVRRKLEQIHEMFFFIWIAIVRHPCMADGELVESKHVQHTERTKMKTQIMNWKKN